MNSKFISNFIKHWGNVFTYVTYKSYPHMFMIQLKSYLACRHFNVYVPLHKLLDNVDSAIMYSLINFLYYIIEIQNWYYIW